MQTFENDTKCAEITKFGKEFGKSVKTFGKVIAKKCRLFWDTVYIYETIVFLCHCIFQVERFVK